MNKARIEKEIARAKEDVAEAAAERPVEVDAKDDPELAAQLVAKKLGHIKDAYRSRNGALVVVR